jgi:predicted nucleotidyltransferase component of viral defense system
VISSAEIRRVAGAQQLDPMLIERDYVLGCYLHYLIGDPVVKVSWIFKGGTCLRKCYFPHYRFSEDLDFTIKRVHALAELRDIIARTNHRVQSERGILLDLQEMVVEMIEDEYGKESFEAKIYYRGPWNFRGSAPALRIHLDRDEEIVFPTASLPIFHPYSDQNDLPDTRSDTYSLEEILVEKLRAFSGQRKYAISRDIYDIYKLTESNVNKKNVLEAFQKKCRVKGIVPEKMGRDSIIRRRKEFEINWHHHLVYLVPQSQKVQFEAAWKRAIELLKEISELL